jgi:hypothetical protein
MRKAHIAAVAILALASCSQRNNSISTRISETLKSGTNRIDLTEIARFDWDQCFVFSPYTFQETITNALGHSWSDYKASGIGHDEGHALIIFQYKGKVAAWCMNPRNNGDFAFLYNSNGYARAEARFAVEYSGNDKRANIKKIVEQEAGPYGSPEAGSPSGQP